MNNSVILSTNKKKRVRNENGAIIGELIKLWLGRNENTLRKVRVSSKKSRFLEYIVLIRVKLPISKSFHRSEKTFKQKFRLHKENS